MKKDKKPYNPAAYPLFGIRLSPHPLQFIVMSHLRVQFVLHLFKEVGATVAFPAFDVRIEAVAVFGVVAQYCKRYIGQELSYYKV